MNTDALADKMLEKNEGALNNIKNALVFNLSWIPEKLYIRKELEEVGDYIAQYVLTGVPNHLIIYGKRGSGKTASIVSLLNSFKKKGKLNFIYLNANDNPTAYRLLGDISDKKSNGTVIAGYSTQDMMKWAKDKLIGRYVVVLDEADLLKDDKILYYLTRETSVNLVLLAHQILWFKSLSDSVKSSLQPQHIFFKDYTTEEITKILKVRAEDGLNSFNEGAISLMGALIARDYESDVRVGIRALFLVGKSNDWTEENIKRMLEKAYKEVEYNIIKQLKDAELLVLRALTENNNTNLASSIAEKYMIENLGYFIKKRQYLNIIHNLNDLGLITIIKKRVGRYYTLEVQLLIQKEIIENEVKARFE